MTKTLYDIEVNPGLLWDYDFSPKEVQDESFFVWYLGRLLERGTATEVKRIPIEVVAKYLNRLSIPGRVRRFWEWYNEAQPFAMNILTPFQETLLKQWGSSSLNEVFS